MIGAPSFLNINSVNGLITASTDNVQGQYSDIIVRATNNTDSSIKIDSDSITVAVNGDPLRTYAWHLTNTGQSTFATFGGTPGVDINVKELYKEGITGSGVRIAVSDTGVELAHDDLHQNTISGAHRDYSLPSPYSTSDPTPTDFHGTAVSGIINAMGWNNFGSIGVAPEAKFAGFQFLNSSQGTSIMIHQASGNFDVFNFSYGDYILEDMQSDDSYIDQLRYNTQTEDKIYVKAAGNEFIALGDGGVCASHNANFPFENETPFIIIVGAVHADGGKSSYSNAGSNIWVSAPGGEDGEGYGPGIITTDLPTCFKGLSKAGVSTSNDFEYNHALNLKCDYTALMNGTSSATPIVTGVIALMKQANTNLKMRDIKHILALTSKQIDVTHSSSVNYYGNSHPSNRFGSCTANLNLAGHTYEQGWVENTAGFKFNNFYGFGLIDAKAAVDMAKNYSSYLPSLIETNPNFNIAGFRSSPNAAIIDHNKAGLEDTISVPNNFILETVQVKVNVTHPRSGEIGVELTSPSGTKSILMNINNSLLFDNDSNLNITLSSNAFYGESSQGDWTIKIIDGRSGNQGTLNRWDLNLLGH